MALSFDAMNRCIFARFTLDDLYTKRGGLDPRKWPIRVSQWLGRRYVKCENDAIQQEIKEQLKRKMCVVKIRVTEDGRGEIFGIYT